MREQVKKISDNLLEALDRRGERELGRQHHSLIRVVHDSDYVRYVNECLEKVDPDGRQALAQAQRMLEE
jgi:hypothetical protein